MLRVLTFVTIAILVVFLVSQMVLPAWRGQKLFPLFRKQGKLESQLADAVQKKEEEKVAQKIEKISALEDTIAPKTATEKAVPKEEKKANAAPKPKRRN